MKKGIKGELEKIKNEVMEAVFPSNIYCICCGSLIDSTRPYSLCDKCVREIHWIGSRTCEKCGRMRMIFIKDTAALHTACTNASCCSISNTTTDDILPENSATYFMTEFLVKIYIRML